MNRDIDQILTDAGQRWQAEQPPPPEPDQARWASGRPLRAGRFITVGVVAAAVAATIAGSMALWPKAASGPEQVPGATTPAATGTAAQGTPLVRDGDVVEAAGEIEFDEGQPVRFCPPAARVLPLPPPPCPLAVTAKGVDLDRLADRKVSDEGRVSGWVRLRGVYRAGTLEVTDQWAERPDNTGPPRHPVPASCEPPSGGWRTENGDSQRLATFVDSHRQRFSGLDIAYPTGRPGSINVMVVGVVGETPAAAQAELARYYDGNLCVVKATNSLAQLDNARWAAAAIMNDQRTTIHSVTTGDDDPEDPRVMVRMVRLDPDTYDKLRAIGLDVLTLDPWLRPAR